MGQAAVAGSIYFAIVFAAGFALGVLRTLVLEPALGAVAAVLAELPVMLGVAWIVCDRLLRRRRLAPAGAWVMGGIAFALLMAAEAGLSVGLAGRSLAEHWALYGDTAHRIGLAGQIAFALFPPMQALRSHRTRGAGGA